MAVSTMTLEQFEEICCELEETHLGLKTLCQKRGFKSPTPFRNLLRDSVELENRYTRARELQLDYLEDLLREASFDESRDGEVVDRVNLGSNAVARDRLKADTIKFILSKLRPHVYGNRVEVKHTGEPRVFNIDYGSDESE